TTAAAAAASAEIVIILVERAAAAARAFTTVEEDQFTAGTLKHHLGGVAVVAAIVGPLPGLDLALEIDLRALAQIMLRDPAKILVEDHDLVPFGLFLAFAGGFVAPALRRGDSEVHHFAAVVERTGLGVRAEIADQDHLVPARHVTLLFSKSRYKPSATAVQ